MTPHKRNEKLPLLSYYQRQSRPSATTSYGYPGTQGWRSTTCRGQGGDSNPSAQQGRIPVATLTSTNQDTSY